MQRHRIASLIAHTFQDVDLTAVGPVGAGHPEGGPDAASAGRHVFEVEDDKAVGIGFGGGDADAVAATPGAFLCGVGAYGHTAAVCVDEAGGLGGVAIDIIDVAMSGVVELGRMLV